MSFFGFGSSLDVSIDLTPTPNQLFTSLKKEDVQEAVLLYNGNAEIAGVVTLKLPAGVKKYEHNGIKLELIGQVEMSYEKTNSFIFTCLVQPLESVGSITENKTYPFSFAGFDKTTETYHGINVRLRYFVRCSIGRNYNMDLIKEQEFAVQALTVEPEVNNSIKMEVGIEDCLHIEFEYNKSKYHLDDVVIGKIYFLLVRIKIKHMEIQLLRRESTGTGTNTFNETDVLTKYEIMDGAPMRGESIPVRLFLEPFDLTPTYKNIHGKFNVKYYLNLVLVDEEERRYFKQQEITLWRKSLKSNETK